MDEGQARLSGGPAASDPPFSDPFERFTDADVRELIGEYPLAWVEAPGATIESATLLPMVAETDAQGRVTGLIGHLSRRNPLHPALVAAGRGHFLFTGPHA